MHHPFPLPDSGVTARDPYRPPDSYRRVAIVSDGFHGAGRAVRWRIPVREQIAGAELFARVPEPPPDPAEPIWIGLRGDICDRVTDEPPPYYGAESVRPMSRTCVQCGAAHYTCRLEFTCFACGSHSYAGTMEET